MNTPSPLPANDPEQFGHDDGGSGSAPLPPQNTEAEQALLGALLYENRLLDRLEDRLRPEHFYVPAHGRIFEAILRLIQRGQVANPKTLRTFFDQDDDLAEVGGGEYLGELAAQGAGGVSAAVVDYAEAIIDLHLRRRLIELGHDISANARHFNLDETAAQQLAEAESQLFTLATSGDTERGSVSLVQAMQVAIDAAEKAYRTGGGITGVTSGFKTLDAKLGGLHPSDLIILAGRPSMGKTALATNIAFRAAHAYQQTQGEEGAPVLMFSLEMSSDQLAGRILADVTRIPSDKIRRGDLSERDLPSFIEASRDLQEVGLFIDDTPALSIGQVRQRARRLHRTNKIGLVVIDYLQLLRGSSSSSDNRVQEISEITRGLKALAKELHVPVIALSQLSRAVEQREDKRPQLADLRESGSIEQDADVVMFVFRESYYLRRAEPMQRPEESQDRYNERFMNWQERAELMDGKAEVIIAKQRHGPIGSPMLSFEEQLTRFDDLDIEHTEY
ncbi:MAG: replicative DNA helicase [Alphaproteobacteria bacterium]|nr:replicative DNA helicase [Alphaproteobacteria bacterium SS10]